MKKYLNIGRILTFLIGVYSLSVFFEAGRLIANEQTFQHITTAVFSLLAFSFCLFVMGYWVYIEDREKNNLRVKFGLYEWVCKISQARKIRKEG